MALLAPRNLDLTASAFMGRSPSQSATEQQTSPRPFMSREARSEEAIRVLLADDHKILRQGLASLLEEEDDIEVVGQASDGAMAVEMATQILPDVVVMDITMPRMGGIEATRRITRMLPEVRVIGLSMHSEADMAQALHDAGAVSYLTKGGPSEALVEAIRQASAGHRA